MSTLKTYDKTGREIMVGDTLKVFHYIGPRHKRFFMFKYVQDGPPGSGRYFRISHLNPQKETYMMLCDGKRHEHIEIVQGYGTDGEPFDKRTRNLKP